MHDWMISKKRYWGLALPIYDCAACGTFDVIGGREELRERAVEGWDAFEGHTPHRPCVDAVTIACPAAARRSSGSRTSATRGWTPGSCRSRRSTSARTRSYWAKWFPADFITESFPGQFRNWFYSMLAMSTVLRREPPFKTIFGYALVFGEDGRPMHKSWGNAIEFDEAAERMGVDVMRWMFAKARPEDNILFGWHAADEARRELLVLWNVYAFFVTYARLAGWTPRRGPATPAAAPSGRSWTAGSCRGRPGTAADVEDAPARLDARRRDPRADRDLHRRPVDLVPAPARATRILARRRRGRPGRRVRDAPRGARRRSRRMLAPILPFLSETMYGNLVATVDADAPDSVHLTRWPAGELARASRRRRWRRRWPIARRAVDLARTLRGTAGPQDPPAAGAGLARRCPDRGLRRARTRCSR